MEGVEDKKKNLWQDHTEINRIEAKYNKEKAMLEEYINSGKYDAYRAKWEQARIDKVRLGKRAMSNATYEGMLLKHATKDGEKVLRAVITSSTWQVRKNEFDLPKYKYLAIDLAVKKDGKCYLLTGGSVFKDYTGGGTYGGIQPYYPGFGSREEMNCNNVNK